MSETKENKMKWYVVRAISGKEKKVKELLEMEIEYNGMQDFVAQILLPIEKVYQIRNGKKTSKEKNLYPGYVFIEANLTNVIGFLSDKKGGEPVPLRSNEVNRMLGKVDEMADSEAELNIPFVVGEAVKVIDGPFNSFSGVIEEINEEKKKLKVMVKIFGRKTPLELSYMQVEKE
jgi:transcriptional antiterminator NusG